MNLRRTALSALAVVIAGLAVFAETPAAEAATIYTVTTADDTNDGTCAGHCTLREAIVAANGHPNSSGADLIQFAIPGAGPHTILVSSALPSISEAVAIDGLTQGAATCSPRNLLIEVSGNAGAGNGLVLAAGSGSTVRGLAIGNFSGGSGIKSSAGGLIVECNNIGVGADGVSARPNATGVTLQGGPSDNTVRWNIIARNNAGLGVGYGVLANPSNGTLISENSIYENVGGTAYGTQSGTGPGIISTSRSVSPSMVYMSAPSAGPLQIGVVWIREFPATTLGLTARFEFFASPTCDTSGVGEGKIYLGSYTRTDIDDGVLDGAVRFGPTWGGTQTLSGWVSGQRITMTATSLSGLGQPPTSTTGFSRCIDPELRIDSTDPPSVPVGIGDPAVALTGSGFDGDIIATVTNGVLQPIATLDATSPSSATLTVPSSVLTVPGGFSILLKHSDPTLGSSVFFGFFIGPRIDALSVSSAAAGSGDVTVGVTGEGFRNAPLNTTVVRINGVPAVTTFVNPTSLTVTLPASALATPGTLQITAFNPNWNAGSNILPFFVTPVAAPIESIDVVTVVGPQVTTVSTTAPSGESVEAETDAGMGTIAVANYDGAPGGVTPASFQATGGYFDVYVAPNSTFASATITFCDPNGGDVLKWSADGGINWTDVPNVVQAQATPPVTCLQFTVTTTSSPSISDLGGTAFAAAINRAPAIDFVTPPPGPVAVGEPASIGVGVSDLDTADFHRLIVDWGDGAVTESALVAGSRLNGSHVYSVAGVYTVVVTVDDGHGGEASRSIQYIVVYDPSAGFVSGGGWINSPAGAYALDPSLTGKATFGFVSQYKKGANVPTGNTQFQFHAAGLDFKSTSYDWLVVAGSKAQYKGTGTINGTGNYRFMLTAIDGNELGGGKPDTFRIRIWEVGSGDLVYDNQLGADENADPTTVLGGGSIVVHKK